MLTQLIGVAGGRRTLLSELLGPEPPSLKED